MIYFGVGLGIRVGIITVDFFGNRTDLGIDLYGRVPVDLTYYLGDSFGLLLEAAFGYGGSGYKPEPPQQQQLPQGVSIPKQDLKFGTTFQIDASAGVRFP